VGTSDEEEEAVTDSPERRVERLEDIEAIRRLKSLYALRFDEALNGGQAFPPDALLDLFTPDALWESEPFGRFEGRDEIRGLLERYAQRVSFCLHFIVGHVIDVGDDRGSASGTWITWQPMTLDGRAMVLAGHYHDDFERDANAWRVKALRLDVAFLTPHDRGWATQRIPSDWKWDRTPVAAQ
jgi:hypothetical protein